MNNFITENNIRSNAHGFLCLSDMVRCVKKNGKQMKNISCLFSTTRFRVWLEANFDIEYTSTYKKDGCTVLKKNKLQQTTGARHTRATWVHAKVFEYAYNELYLGNKKPASYRLEYKFIESLRVLLDGIIDFEVQKAVLNYRVDIYLPDINLCVEFDEKHHDGKTNSQQDEDRQAAIEMFLGCKFIRIKEGEHLVGINRILRELDLSY